MGRGGLGCERRGGAQAQKAPARGGGKGLDTGVGQGGRKGGLAEVDAAKRLSSSSAQMGRGEDLLLALSEQEDEPMDYERLAESSEAFVYAAMTRLMVRRLARA